MPELTPLEVVVVLVLSVVMVCRGVLPALVVPVYRVQLPVHSQTMRVVVVVLLMIVLL
jgi:hypothetical protein